MSGVSAEAVSALEDRDAAGRGLRIEFFRLRDRYAHRILAVGCEELPVLLLQSIEGTEEDHWPPSPAFQALNFEQIHIGEESVESPPTAMLVGMSGSTHWSMSVNPLSNSESDDQRERQPGFHFDAAGRLKSPPKVLSTRYLVGKRVQVQLSGNEMLLHFGSGRSQLNSCFPKGIVDSSGWRFDNRRSEMAHELVASVPQLQLPATIRWGYTLRLLSD